jgi:hypothetical protein
MQPATALVAAPGVNAIDMMSFIPVSLFWALMIITVNVVALFGTCAYAGRQSLAA